MSNFLNLASRRIAADLYGGAEEDLGKVISAVGYDGREATYISRRARLWFTKWAAGAVEHPETLTEDPDEDLSAYVPVEASTAMPEPDPDAEPEVDPDAEPEVDPQADPFVGSNPPADLL